SALNPAARIDARHKLTTVVNGATGAVRDHTAMLVKRHLVERRTEVTDGTVHGIHRDVPELAGALSAALPVRQCTFDADTGNTCCAQHLHRLRIEVQVDAARRVSRFTFTPATKNPVDDKQLFTGRDGAFIRLIDTKIGVIE